jgi:hypothetical protein
LKLEIVTSDSKIDFYTQFYMNLFKHKSLYFQLNFS